MTEQLYRRRAGEPVQVWRVGDGEPPEWASPDLFPTLAPADGRFVIIRRASGWTMLNAEAFERDYEPLPAPAPDAEKPRRPRNTLGGFARTLELRSEDLPEQHRDGYAPAPDAREALEIAKAALAPFAAKADELLRLAGNEKEVYRWSMSMEWGDLARAREALARIGGGA